MLSPAIESYINDYVGLLEDGYGNMYHQKTLEDWSQFNINNRTKHDATISSGLAIMACNKNRYRPTPLKNISPMKIGIKRYDNKGFTSKIIK